MTVADKLDKVDRLLRDASRATAHREHGLAIGCTEWQAAWCPIHGDCCCENEDDWRPGTNGCKLHLAERTPTGVIFKGKDAKIFLDGEEIKDASLGHINAQFDHGLSWRYGENRTSSSADCSGLVINSLKILGVDYETLARS